MGALAATAIAPVTAAHPRHTRCSRAALRLAKYNTQHTTHNTPPCSTQPSAMSVAPVLVCNPQASLQKSVPSSLVTFALGTEQYACRQLSNATHDANAAGARPDHTNLCRNPYARRCAPQRQWLGLRPRQSGCRDKSIESTVLERVMLWQPQMPRSLCLPLVPSAEYVLTKTGK